MASKVYKPLEINGKPVRKYIVESLEKLDDPRRPLKEIAIEECIDRKSLSQRRRRFEKKHGVMLPRHEKRGRKPKPPASCAA